jgi:hypothetical protein
MLGASNSIPGDALPLFTGKRVRIYPHSDEAGKKAAKGWASQLRTVGAEVEGFGFAGLRMACGAPVRDLNDLVNANLESLEGVGHSITP